MRAQAGLRAAVRALGYDLVRADHYSPVPDLRAVPARVLDEPAEMPGVDLRLDASLGFLREQLGPFIREYPLPAEPPGTEHGYHAGNFMYSHVDAEVLYAMVRHLRPRRIVEIGPGWSSRVIRDALARNAADGVPAPAHRLFDPEPGEAAARIGDARGLEPLTAQAIGADVFAALGEDDLLVIDSTHTVKVGGDVNRLVLEVLPELAGGVVVHLHDFFRPFEYSRAMLMRGHFWQEHHLLQAFLAFNDAFEVLAANHALGRLRAAELGEIIPGIPPGTAPGSALWLRRTA